MENEINEFGSLVEELHSELYEMKYKAYKAMLDTQLNYRHQPEQAFS